MLLHVLTHTFPSLRDPSHLPFDLTDVLACGSLGCSMKRASSLGVLNEPDNPVGELKVRRQLSFLLSLLTAFSVSNSVCSCCLSPSCVYLSFCLSIPPALFFLAHLPGHFTVFQSRTVGLFWGHLLSTNPQLYHYHINTH